MARKIVPSQARPPSSPRRCAPFQSAEAARTGPQDPSHATTRAPNTHRQTDASAQCGCPSSAPARSDVRFRRQTTPFAPGRRSAVAQAPVPQSVHAHQARQAARPSVERRVDRHERCAQGANSGEPFRPSVSSCGADTCAESNLTRRFKKIPKVGTTCPNQLSAPPIPLIRLTPLLAKSQKLPPNCASWARSTSRPAGSVVALRPRQKAKAARF